MGQPQARRGDRYIGTGTHNTTDCPHRIVGQFVGGSDDVYVNNKKAVHRNVRGISKNCPHHTAGDIAISGSQKVKINGKSAHRKLDRVKLVCGQAITIEGSKDVITG